MNVEITINNKSPIIAIRVSNTEIRLTKEEYTWLIKKLTILLETKTNEIQESKNKEE